MPILYPLVAIVDLLVHYLCYKHSFKHMEFIQVTAFMLIRKIYTKEKKCTLIFASDFKA